MSKSEAAHLQNKGDTVVERKVWPNPAISHDAGRVLVHLARYTEEAGIMRGDSDDASRNRKRAPVRLLVKAQSSVKRRTVRVVKAELEAHVINAALVSIRVRPNCVDTMRLCAESIVVFLTIPGQNRLQCGPLGIQKKRR